MNRRVRFSYFLAAGLLAAGDLGLAAAAPVSGEPSRAAAGGETSQAWFHAGARTAHPRQGRARARNLILFLGDGMSLPTVAAARILEGQRRGEPGEENLLAFERLPYTAFAKTYNTDSQTPDSAGTMSALATGVKTRRGLISAGPEAARGDCTAALAHPLTTVFELAESAGLSTGLVTTTRLTHATPAALYAHSADRDWEADVDLPPAAVAAGCRDIARQWLDFDAGGSLKVALGGGRREFLPASEPDPEYPQTPGRRLDGRDLVQEWRVRHPEGAYVWNKAQFDALDLDRTPRLLGLFEPDHMQFEHDRPRDPGGEPSLAKMTRAAIRILQRNRSGFVLLVEGGRIDHAHHEGNAHRALTDTVAFSDAVAAALELTSESDTLVLVTADHSHTLGFGGYPVRGNPILGKVVSASVEQPVPALARDAVGLPYTTLFYGNGPGYAGRSYQQPAGPKKHLHKASGFEVASGRPDLAEVDTTHPDHLQEAMVPLASETHGGDDVGVWASGPGAEAIRGTLEQNAIFHLWIQPQPALWAEICRLSGCRGGMPAGLPDRTRLRREPERQAAALNQAR
jgi:alkaline phosphatase